MFVVVKSTSIITHKKTFEEAVEAAQMHIRKGSNVKDLEIYKRVARIPVVQKVASEPVMKKRVIGYQDTIVEKVERQPIYEEYKDFPLLTSYEGKLVLEEEVAI